jgi:hypothetical protein
VDWTCSCSAARFMDGTDLFDSLMHLDDVGVMQILENVHFSHYPLEVLDVLNMTLVC